MTPFEICRTSIELLTQNPALGNDLNALAARFQLSPSHYQKTFKKLVGISPKQFQQALLVQLSQPKLMRASLLETSEALQLSSPSRLHDAYVQIEAMSPGEFKSLGEQLHFQYTTEPSVFGDMLVITTARGLFYLGFLPQASDVITRIKKQYPKSQLCKSEQPLLGFDPFLEQRPMTLHVSATNFQVQVWKALLHSVPGQLTSYKNIAHAIGNPKGARGVGQAVGANPVAYLIPCHRVIKQNGALSGYRWGEPNKQALLAWEYSQLNQDISL